MTAIEWKPYQLETIEHFEDFDFRSLGALDMGLGKTWISLETMRKHAQRLFPAVVVCPSSVKYSWQWNALHHFNMRAAVCEGKTPPRNVHGFHIRQDLTIINYDILKNWVDHFRSQRIKTIFFDECQNLSNPQAYRTQAAMNLARVCKHVIALSGRPISNRPEEYWPILHMLWPSEFPSLLRYQRRYCNPRWTPWGWNYNGASNIDELRKKLIVLGTIRFRKQDVLKDLPPKVRRIIPIELRNRGEYEKADRDFMTWLKENMAHRVRKAEKAEKLTKLGYQLRLASRLKLKGVVDWTNDFLKTSNEKFVLYGVHTSAIDVFKRRIDAKHVCIDGSVPSHVRHGLETQFRDDPDTRLFIGNIIAGGVGLNLQAASETGIAEIPWRPGDLAQAEDRTWRIGQDKPVFINYFVAGNTIEEKLCEVIDEKQKVISSLLDGGPVEGDFNIHEELLRKLEGTFL